jgi:hypothetical protein
MLRQGVSGLTDDQRTAWARLIVSFGARTPETLRLLGTADYRNAKKVALEHGPLGTQFTATALLERERPMPEHTMSMETAVELPADPTKIFAVAAMEWWLRRFEGKTLLFSDRPLLTQPRIA